MSYNKTKCDATLGHEIQKHLEKCGVQTPTVTNSLSRTQKIDIIEDKFRSIMETLGLDLSDDSLVDTPLRVGKLLVNETMWGLDPEAFPKCTAVENKMNYDEMVTERNINVMSNCEHHWIVIDGLATVSYIPNKTVLGLSKINRVVEYFSKRPQIQERLTEQIYHALQYILDTNDVAVIVDAKHYCVAARGVEDTGSSTVTSKLGGVYKSDPAVRAEFMAIAHRG